MCSKRVPDICQLDMGCMEGLALSKQKIHTASPMVVCNILWIEDMLEMIRNSWLWLTHIKRCRNRFVLPETLDIVADLYFWLVAFRSRCGRAVWSVYIEWMSVIFLERYPPALATQLIWLTPEYSKANLASLSWFPIDFPEAFFRCHCNHSHAPNFP